MQLNTAALSTIATRSPPPTPLFSPPQATNRISKWRKSDIRSTRGAARQDDCPISPEFNLYELLGVDASSDKARIKEAYRALQKRCHPDIAGPTGHDMAIVLNEAYALLSDPGSRTAYDKELAKVADLQGYTGRPVYSIWLGPESEERAIFVDEVKCVGCLKCALFADKTFAIESVYGRARVVAQWADPEYKIQEAIGACPVDCISVVERRNLAALEFLMCKQQRGKVRIGVGNTVGARTSDIFDELDKFQARYSKHKAATHCSESRGAQKSSRASAIRAIQMISNWLYWKSPAADGPRDSQPGPRKLSGPRIERLEAAAAARKRAAATPRPKRIQVEYWAPSAALVLPDAAGQDSRPEVESGLARSGKPGQPIRGAELLGRSQTSDKPLGWGLPLGMAVAAAAYARLHLGEAAGGVKDHVGGSLAVAIVNSSWMQVGLAGVTWFLIGTYAVELILGLRRK